MAQGLVTWCRSTALPFWADRGFDSRGQRFRERLTFAGTPVEDVPIRSMVQARQIFVTSEAQRLGWLAGGGELAERAMRSLQRDFCTRASGRAGCAFSIAADGTIVSSKRDAYTHAFVIFAAASLFRLTGDRRHLAFADEIMSFLDAELTDPVSGGLWTEAPRADSIKRQNPHMHLLEACLALAVAAPTGPYLERATRLVELFRSRMYDRKRRALVEFYAHDWSRHQDAALRNVIEPGHQFEWAWLLDRYAALTGEDAADPVEALFDTARSKGLSKDGYIIDELGARLRPTKTSTRLWPHTEALKAAAILHERGRTDAHAFADAISETLQAAFLDRPFAGGWTDHLSPARTSLVDYVPASSFYHLFYAATEMARVFGNQDDGLEARDVIADRAPARVNSSSEGKMDHFDFTGCRILVIGDVMIDKYLSGSAARLSPEAPVPVLLRHGERSVLGGAANVAANIAALGATVRLVGVIGDDATGAELSRLVCEMPGMGSSDLVAVPQRPTTCKTRIMSGLHQMVRVDSETTAPISIDVEDSVIERIGEHMSWCDVVVVSDYAKGFCSDRVIRAGLELAAHYGKASLIDPKRRDFSIYRGATIITPNCRELTEATRLPCDTDEDAWKAAREAIRRTGAAILLTRSEKGMSHFKSRERPLHVRTAARDVFDVSGAGDTVVAVAALALAAHLPIEEGMRIANVAAGIVVSRVGTATVSIRELSNALEADLHRTKPIRGSVVDLDTAAQRRLEWRAAGMKVGFTNGVFDLLHPGHVSLLKRAAAECDRLIVAINSDASVQRLKGPSRPVQGEDARAFVLGALSAVDLVMVFEEDTPAEVIDRLKPDLLVKGGDYTIEQVVGADTVYANGGEVLIVPIMDGHSTTTMIGKAHDGKRRITVGAAP